MIKLREVVYEEVSIVRQSNINDIEATTVGTPVTELCPEHGIAL